MSGSSTICKQYNHDIDGTDTKHGMDEKNHSFTDPKTVDLPIKFQHLQSIEERINFYICPQAREKIDPKQQTIEITIGDLHGNALKFIYFLIREGMLKLENDTDYDELVKIYQLKSDALQKSDLDKFNRILSKAKINHIGTVRLIGDELCDRGSNDYFTLKIIEKLKINEVPLEIILSNHGVEFIRVCETPPMDSKDGKASFTPPPCLEGEYAKSLFNLQNLIDRNLITRKEILDIAKNHYKRCIKALSFTVSPDRKNIIIYSHAPIGINTIELLANKCKVKFDDSSVTALAITINNINAHIKELINKNEFSTFLDENVLSKFYDKERINQITHPFEFLMWNRDYRNITIQRPHQHKSYTIYYGNGHAKNKNSKNLPHAHNLDNTLGKGIFMEGRYTIIRSIYPQQLKKTFDIIARLRKACGKASPSLKKAGLNVADEASALAMKITTIDELAELDGYLMESMRVFFSSKPLDAPATLREYADRTKGKPNYWKKFMGALSILAGVALICIGVLGTPFTGGTSLVAGMYAGGSLLTAGGAALFYHGRQKGISKALENLADEAEKPSSRR